MSHRATAWILLSAITTLPAAAAPDSEATSLRTVEGRVVEVRREAGEGDLELLAVRLQPGDADASELVILLAPHTICEEIGFEVEAGDRLRARIFVQGDGPARAQKALNMTRGRMARFRTLRNLPLWTAGGDWHGGPSRMAPGMGHAPRHHGGGGPGGC